jgi:hypothetical protein
MGITQIKEWYNRFKYGRTSVKSVARPGRSPKAEITSSLTKCVLWSCRIIVSPSKNLRRRGGDEHWISTFHFDRWFGHADSVREIRAEAPAHSSQLIQIFLTKHNIPVVRQAPYSPDMAPCNFWLFSHLKTQLKGTRFESGNDIIRNTTANLYSNRK